MSQIETTSSADGKFHFDLPHGGWNVVLLRNGFAPVLFLAKVVEPGRNTTLGNVNWHEGGGLSFRVTDATTGTPIRDATVAWDPPVGQFAGKVWGVLLARLWSGRTDSGGRIKFDHLATVKPAWTITKTGYVPGHVAAASTAAGKRQDLGSVMLTTGARLTVNVVCSRELLAVLPRATIELTYLDYPRGKAHGFAVPTRKVFSTESGPTIQAFEFEAVPAGHYQLIIRGEGKTWAMQDVDVGSGPQSVRVTLEPSTVWGCVTRGGEAVSRAEIDAGELGSTEAGADGCYELRVYSSGEIGLLARSPHSAAGMGARKEVLLSTHGQTIQVNFDLPIGRIRVHVEDSESGEPITGATVFVHAEYPTSRSPAEDVTVAGSIGLSRTTDPSGNVELDALPTANATLIVQDATYETQKIPVSANQLTDQDGPPLVVDLMKASAWKILILDWFGTPVSGASLISVASTEYETFTSDSAGRVEITSPPDRPQLFYAGAPGYAVTPSILAPQKDPSDTQTITLYPPEGAPLIALHADGTAMLNVDVAVGFPGDEPFATQAWLLAASDNDVPTHLMGRTSYADGSIALSQFLSPGRYRFYVISHASGQDILYPIGDFTLPLTEARPVVISK